MGALRHPLLSLVRVVDLQLEVRVELVVAVDVVPGRELGVGREGGAGDVVCHEGRVGVDVTEGDHVVLADDSSSSRLRELVSRLDDPVVVRVVEGVSCDLLSCGCTRSSVDTLLELRMDVP